MNSDTEQSSSNSLSIADLLLQACLSWRTFFALMLMIAISASILLGGIAILKKMFSVGSAEVKVSSAGGPEVFFQSATGEKTFLVVVHPQGWQSTRIQVEEGDTIDCKAEGRVQLDLWGLMHNQKVRHRLEEQMRRKYHISETGSDTPEAHYGDKEWKSIELVRGWISPEGNNAFQSSFGGRRIKRLASDQPYGLLLGTIQSGGDEAQPGKSERLIPIGSSASFPAYSNCQLWLTVNDVINDFRSSLFYDDNIGFFTATITVKPKPKGWSIFGH